VRALFTPFRSIILFAGILLAGIWAVQSIPISLSQEAKPDVISIAFSAGPATPKIVEQGVTAVIENACSGIPGMIRMLSESGSTGGTMQLYFTKGTDIMMKKIELQGILRRVYPKLPAGTGFPTVELNAEKTMEEHRPLLAYAVSAPTQYNDIEAVTQRFLLTRLAMVNGIKDITLRGAARSQVTVTCNENKCAAWGIGREDITKAINEYFKKKYFGAVESMGEGPGFLHLSSDYGTAGEIEGIHLQSKAGCTVSIGELSQVSIAPEPARSLFRINGSNTVNFAITAKDKVSETTLAKKINKIIEEAERYLPRGYHVNKLIDKNEYFSTVMHTGFVRLVNFLSILMFFVLLWYRSLRGVVVMIVSLAATVALMSLFVRLTGINVTLYTIEGLTVTLGMVVSNLLLVLQRNEKQSFNRNIRVVVACSINLITCLLFSMHLPKLNTADFRHFAYIVIAGLVASQITIIGFLPSLTQVVFKQTGTRPKRKWFKHARKKARALNLVMYHLYARVIIFCARFRKTLALILLLAFGLPVFLLPAKQPGRSLFAQYYNNTIGSNQYQENWKEKVDAALGGTLRLFLDDISERNGYRQITQTKLIVMAHLPDGSEVWQMNQAISWLETYLQTVHGIDRFLTTVASGRFAIVEITFQKAYDNDVFPYMLKSAIVGYASGYGGMKWDIVGVGTGFSNAGLPSQSQFNVQMKGYNIETLGAQVQALASYLSKNPRVQNINANQLYDVNEINSKEYTLDINPELLARSGNDHLAILHRLANLSKPTGASGTVTIGNKKMPVVVKSSSADSFSVLQMMDAPLQTAENKKVRVSDIGQLKYDSLVHPVHKMDRQYIQVLGLDYMGSHHIGEIFLERKLDSFQHLLPIGYTANMNNDNEVDAPKNESPLLVVALLLMTMYAIFSMLLESVRLPLLILAIIPASFIGIFLAFYWGDYYFDQGGYMSFLYVAGIVTNNAAQLVSDVKQSPPAQPFNRSLLRVSYEKLGRMTVSALALFCGLLPFIAKGQNQVFWFCFSVGTIGGLLVSLVAVYILFPVFLFRKTRTGKKYIFL
jgi:multidrug efflux pump subunit AcrB